jgi:enoyl-CoA hydratase
MTDAVLTEAREGVLIITLNRPEAKNAANRALAEGVAAAIDQLEADDSLRCAILTGAGGTFCSGMDLKAFVSTARCPPLRGGVSRALRSTAASKPIIAAVEGYALAGGFELAISCDLIVAASDSKFGIPEVKRGLAAAAGGLVKLPKQIPYRVSPWNWRSRVTSSAHQRAYELGLVNRVSEGARHWRAPWSWRRRSPPTALWRSPPA